MKILQLIYEERFVWFLGSKCRCLTSVETSPTDLFVSFQTLTVLVFLFILLFLLFLIFRIEGQTGYFPLLFLLSFLLLLLLKLTAEEGKTWISELPVLKEKWVKTALVPLNWFLEKPMTFFNSFPSFRHLVVMLQKVDILKSNI